MRRSLAAVALAAAALAAPSAPAQAAEVTHSPDATAVSVNGFNEPDGKLRPLAPRHAGLIGEAGIRLARSDAFWPWAEPRAPFLGLHDYRWGDFDATVGLLAQHGIRWLPVLGYSTLWSTSVTGTDHAPPVDQADYLAYAEALARRYGRGGAFWATRDPLPVTAYQVWNEPNLDHFWLPKPDPAAYAQLYLATREAIRRADPQATTVMAGMSPYSTEFVERMYAAMPELRDSVDAVAYHPYREDVEHVLRLVRKMRATTDGAGDTDVPMWITELGWPSQGRGWLPRPLPDRTRGGNLSLTTDALLGSNCDVDVVSAYTWVTPESDPDHDDQWLGIYRADGRPTEAGLAYRESVARNASLAAGGARPALALCEGPHRGGAAAKPLKLGLALRTAGGRCFEATLTYAGRPLNGIGVQFAAGGKRLSADTGDHGVARGCLPKATARRKLAVSARILDVAASKTARVRVP